MPNYQRLKRTASGVLTGQPAIGELILNTPSGYLYTTRDDGTLVLINNGIPGPPGPSGVQGPAGAGLVPYYGSFYSTVNQTNASGTAVNNITYNSTVEANGVAVVSGNVVQVANSGVYNVQFSAQIQKSNASSEDVQIWLMKNSNNVPDSNTSLTIQGSNNRLVAAWNWFITLDRNEHIGLRWHSTDTSLLLLASGVSSVPTRPSIPSVILTVNRVA
jgi:hypothetical protein